MKISCYIILFFAGCVRMQNTPLGGAMYPQSSPQRFHAWSSDMTALWHTGIIDFYLSPAYSDLDKQTIRDSLGFLSNQLSGCIKFKELSRAPHGYSYLEIIPGTTCQSPMGKQIQGKTVVELNPNFGCLHRGKTLHEIVHALGAAHEHSRPDRDVFVSINFNNVQQDFMDDFKITNQYVNTYKTPYDFYSIMHYGGFAHAASRQYPTITSNLALDPDPLATMQRESLSPVDIVELSRAYNCPNIAPNIMVEYGNYVEYLFTKLVKEYKACVDSLTSQDVANKQDSRCAPINSALDGLLEEIRTVIPNKYPAYGMQQEQLKDRLHFKTVTLGLSNELEQSMNNLYNNLKTSMLDVCRLLSNMIDERSHQRLPPSIIENKCLSVLSMNNQYNGNGNFNGNYGNGNYNYGNYDNGNYNGNFNG